MPLIWADRARWATTTAGTGPITPGASVIDGGPAITDVMATNDTAYFMVEDGGGGWQYFRGTWNGTAIERTAGVAGTNGTGNTNLSGAGQEIWIDAGGAIFASLTGATGGLEWAQAALRGAMPTDEKTGDYTIVSGDRGRVIEFVGSSASTFTLPDPATVGTTWSCTIAHNGTGTTAAAKKLALSGTIDGATDPAIYPGDVRVIRSNGTALKSFLLRGGYIEIAYSDSPFTLTYPPGHAIHSGRLWGAGAGGGSGRRGAAGSDRRGGSAGAGGAYNEFDLPTSLLGAASATITIGQGGPGGTAPTTDSTDGNAGTAGGNTTFGTLGAAYGGGRGSPGTASNQSGGGGGGIGGAGQPGNSSAVFGGAPGARVSADRPLGMGGGGNSAQGANTYGGGWGGGAGGGAINGIGGAGGGSTRGGHGGGGGGGLNTSNTETAGGDAGSLTATGTTGGGAAARGNGADGTASTALGPGTAGQGGGSNNAGGGGAGGNGGLACGGGGAGAGLNGFTGGKGGDGGNGFVRYWYRP